MKKKIMLLLTLIVSLFIYSSRVDAVVMWMQCTSNPNDKISKYIDINKIDDSAFDYSDYNTIAVINSYSNSYDSIRHIAYTGNKFINPDVQSPNFFVNYKGENTDDLVKKERNICWYSKNEIASSDVDIMIDDCDYKRDNPFVPKYSFDNGICPEAFYDSDVFGGMLEGDNRSQDFVFAAGQTSARGAVEQLGGQRLVMYRASYNDLNNGKHYMWIMETYNSTGSYGILYGIDIETARYTNASRKYITDDDIYYIPMYFLGIPVRKDDEMVESAANDLNVLFKFYDDLSGSNVYVYDGRYMNFTQSTQLLRIDLSGRNYFKIDEPIDYVLLGDLHYDNLSGKFTSIVDSSMPIYRYGPKNSDAWDITKDWYSESSSALIKSSNFLKSFPNPDDNRNDVDDVNNTYYDFIKEAEKFNDSFKENNLSKITNNNIDDLLSNFDSAYYDLEKAVKNSETGFPKYVLNSEFSNNGHSYSTGVELTDPSAYGKKNYCVASSDSTESKPLASLVNYFSCNTFGFPFDYVDKNFVGQGKEIAKDVFYKVMQEQVNKLSNLEYDVNFLNADANLKRYALAFAKYASYINEYYSDSFNSQQKAKIKEIVKKYQDFVRDNYKVEIVINCDTLLGKDFLDKISNFTDIIKIAVPILLIGFGIFDFVSAFFAGDAEKMKKAQQKFIMRIVIAILFFLMPFILKIILTIANKAWSFISPSGCNIM